MDAVNRKRAALAALRCAGLLAVIVLRIILALVSVAYIYYGVVIADDGWNLFNLIPVFIIVLMVMACFD